MGKEDIDKAFNELKNEFRSTAAGRKTGDAAFYESFGANGRGGGTNGPRRGQRRRGSRIFSEEDMPGGLDPNPLYNMWENEEERRTFVRKQSEWINKAVDLASDLNESFTSSTKEREQNEKNLKTMRDWFKVVIGDDYEEGNINSNNKADGMATAEGDTSDSSLTYSPTYEVQNTNEAVVVYMDVPGVEKTDIDIKINEDDMTLTISGERRFPAVARDLENENNTTDNEMVTTSTPSSTVKMFSKEFAFDETVDKKNISATLENGVLLVRAPKILPREDDDDYKKKGRTVPIM